ncbi:MAG: type II toxin-antitoxin system Phd/YefM family antitoxin [Planctomycetes bacterium]|nr:type II toxin-antitoxin system Phd/YefM family antitoxin [Planctomycetota bacterium]
MSGSPQFLERDGRPAFAVLPIEEYEALRRRLEDLEDLAALCDAEKADAGAGGRPLADVLRDHGLDATPARDQ